MFLLKIMQVFILQFLVGGFTHSGLWGTKTNVLGDHVGGRGEGTVASQRDGDLSSLQTKVKPKAAGKPLLNSRETGVPKGNLRLGPTFSPFAFSSSSFHCHDHVWGFCFFLFFLFWPPQGSCSHVFLFYSTPKDK